MYSDRQSDPFQATKIQKPEPNVWWKIKMKRKDKKKYFSMHHSNVASVLTTLSRI